jgi:hypothetical protein
LLSALAIVLAPDGEGWLPGSTGCHNGDVTEPAAAGLRIVLAPGNAPRRVLKWTGAAGFSMERIDFIFFSSREGLSR